MIAALLALSAGCVTGPIVEPTMLMARADEQTRRGAWHDAVASYDEFLARFPDDSSARQVREKRDTLAAMMRARTELAHQRDELDRLREDRTRLRYETTALRDELRRLHDERGRLREQLLRRERELALTRQELAARQAEGAARQAESERLRKDIERLKEIDLNLKNKQ